MKSEIWHSFIMAILSTVAALLITAGTLYLTYKFVKWLDIEQQPIECIIVER